MNKKYRLVTRSDIDGLVSGTLLKYLNLIDEVCFVHPNDMQNGKIKITNNDITTNLPYVKEAFLSFDHHYSEVLRNKRNSNHIIDSISPSTALVIYNYYGGNSTFPMYFTGMMNGSNKSDIANFSLDDILKPRSWTLLSFLMDSRTGLGRFKNFRISNYQMMMDLIDYCLNHHIDQILKLPDIKERIELYFTYEEEFKNQLKKCTKIIDNVLVTDYRNEKIIYPGNRFIVYVLFPNQNISLHIVTNKNEKKVTFSVGKSIFNKTSNVNIGKLMLKYNGGGHESAGACQVEVTKSNLILEELVQELKTNKIN